MEDKYSFFKTASPDRYELLKVFAKENRKNQTDAESFLWHHLKGVELGFRFRRQHVINDYIADFVCLEKWLVIEVDGGYHYTQEQKGLDAYRTEMLGKYGFRVIRFSNDEIIGNIDNIIDTIKEELRK